MRIEEVGDPRPGPREAAVRIRAAGVNPVDHYIRTGAYPRKPQLPYTPGSDGAGEIAAVGSEFTRFKPGDRVYIAGYGSMPAGAGTYAELAVCSADQLYPLPARTSFAQGAALGVPYATAYRALFQRGNAQPAETVLVHGATGGVGLAAVQLAHARGLRVIGSGGTEGGLQTVRKNGADVVVNHRSPGYLDEIKAATSGRGVDLVIEMAAHINLDQDLSILAPRGRVVVVGNRGRVEIDARQTMSRDAAILGMTLFNATDADVVEIHAALFAGLDNGTLEPVVGQEFQLADAARAHDAVMQSGAHGKIVLIP